MEKTYIGRFAPSPTGRLHIGSLFSATASYLHAKSRGGLWLVRMEDLDPPREVKGAADDILRTLEAFGLEWDREVVYQSRRHHLYRQALDFLREKGLVYPCNCSRKTMRQQARRGIDGFVYSGRCREYPVQTTHCAWRLRTENNPIVFDDEIVGIYRQNLAQDIGDFVLLRADGFWAYQLAVVVDDAEQGISHVVRGQDLLVSTPRQIYLQGCLNYPAVHYAHLPLLTNAKGQKWSKQTFAPALEVANKGLLLRALLQQFHFTERLPESEDCRTLLDWASTQWFSARLPTADICVESGYL